MTSPTSPPWRNLVAGVAVAGTAIGIGWALFQKLEEYDLKLAALSAEVDDVAELVRQSRADLGNRASGASVQRTQITSLLNQIINTQQKIRSTQSVNVTLASLVRDLSRDHDQLQEAILDVGADIQFKLGFHEGKHHSSADPDRVGVQ